jgi:hypothetical protein
MKKQKECQVVFDDDGVPVVMYDGVKIAKRGLPGTPYTGQWVSLEPGYAVRDNLDMTEIEIEISGVRVH